MIHERLNHYRITAKIGEGGMGEVYRAEDTRLGRDVALKMLPADTTASPERLGRFQREARTVAALNHPNIVTLFSVEQDGDVHFLTMELVEGKALSELLPAGGFELDTFFDLAIPITDALATAHDRGIVHRDLKPANVMVTDEGRRVKVLDFGLAKLAGSEPSSDDTEMPTRTAVTQAGAILGTPHYMSPEQARGEACDHRSDIFSFGVMLYEMATGQRPFKGKTSIELLSSVLKDPAPLAHETRPELPAAIGRVVGRCLEKAPAARYQTVREAYDDLRDVRGGGAETEVPKVTVTPADSDSGIQVSIADTRRTVAVLPFPLLAGGAEDEFLSVALAEAVTHGLSQNPELAVRPTSAVMRYATGNADPRTVARELNVEVVVEGSIQRLGPSVRVQLQAWEAAKQATLLSKKLDGRMAELFDLQDRLADAVASGMGIKKMGPVPAGPPTTSPRAYENYLRASERLLRYTKEGTRDAIEKLRSAVQMDPRFAEAWARLGSAAVTMAVLFDPDSRWYSEAETAVDRALKIDPGNAEAWSARGRTLWSPHHGFRHADALRCFGKTHDLASRPHDGPLWEGVVFLHIGLHDEARSLLREALEDQPDDLIALLSLGEVEHFDGSHAAAQELYERTLAQDPSHVFGNMFVQAGLLYMDELDKAEKGLARAWEIVGEDSLLRSARALLWAKRGETDRADQCVRRAVKNLQSLSHAHHTRHYVAAALATMGQPERALEQMRLAAETGLPNYPLFLNDPHFQSLRGREDCREFLATLKPGWEAFRREFGRA